MRTVLITGAGGYIGSRLLQQLATHADIRLVAFDLIATPKAQQHPSVSYVSGDIRDHSLRDAIDAHHPDCVIHLASVVSTGGDVAHDYSIDVEGSENVLRACVASGVGQIIVTSSGAAYGYHADNPDWLGETDRLRGNDDFPYARHKRLVEELFARYRQNHPDLRQLILRPGTVLGETTNNQITALFDKPVVLHVAGSKRGFVFIWDEDVIAIIEKGVLENRQGVFNLAGDGALQAQDIARILGKPKLSLPAWLLRFTMNLLHALRLSRLDGRYLKFIQYRPVLKNHALKNEFGYEPRKTSQGVFEFFVQHQRNTAQGQVNQKP